MIPKLSATSPLAKAITTLEGVVLAACAAVPWVVTLVDPSKLSSPAAAKWSVISGIALGVSRTAIKVVTAVKGATGIAPEPIDLEALAENVASKIGTKVPTSAELKQLVTDAIGVARDPGSIISDITGGAAVADPREATSPAPAV